MRSPTAASRNTAGEALNVMVIAGHPIERMASWLMVIVAAVGSTAVMTPAPSAVVASAGLDALAHALEGYVSKFANPLADAFAESAARTLFARLPETQARPDDSELRLEVMQAAMLAGWVQNLKVPGVGHAIAHQLGKFGIAHGAACGALLAPAIEFNCGDEATAKKFTRLAQTLGLHDTAGLISRVRELRQQLGSTQGLGALAEGGAEAVRTRRPEIATGALADVCARANPRPVDAAVVEAILAEALA